MYNKYQAHGFGLRQWSQANLAYIDRLIGCAQPVVVWLSSSSELLDNLLVDYPLRSWRSQIEQRLESMPVDLGLTLTSGYYLKLPLRG